MYSWQDDEGEEGEGEGDFSQSSGKSLTLFLVEATQAMGEAREGDPDNYTALQRSTSCFIAPTLSPSRALSCAHDVIKSKIFSSDKVAKVLDLLHSGQ